MKNSEELTTEVNNKLTHIKEYVEHYQKLKASLESIKDKNISSIFCCGVTHPIIKADVALFKSYNYPIPLEEVGKTMEDAIGNKLYAMKMELEKFLEGEWI